MDNTPHTFRLSPKTKYQGMAFTAIFLGAMLWISSVFLLENPADHGFKGKHSVAIVGGMGIAVFGSMVLLSLYIWRAYYVEQITIDNDNIVIRSMFQNRAFAIDGITSLTWRTVPMGGSLIVRSATSKARVDLHGYRRADRLQIIRLIHDRVPLCVQQNWPVFCHKLALPLRDGQPATVRTEPTAEVITITRQRYDWLAKFALPLSILVAVSLWLWTERPHILVFPASVLFMWLLLRLSVPAEGRAVERLSGTRKGRAFLLTISIIATNQLLVLPLVYFGFEKETICLIRLIALLPAFPTLIYGFHSAAKQQRLADEQAGALAVFAWEDGATGQISASGAVGSNTRQAAVPTGTLDD